MWLLFKSPFVAHIVLLAAIPIVFVPTIKSAWADARNENSKAWLLWSVSDLLMLVIIISRLDDVKELPYAIVVFVCHFTLLIVLYKNRIASVLGIKKYIPLAVKLR